MCSNTSDIVYESVHLNFLFRGIPNQRSLFWDRFPLSSLFLGAKSLRNIHMRDKSFPF